MRYEPQRTQRDTLRSASLFYGKKTFFYVEKNIFFLLTNINFRKQKYCNVIENELSKIVLDEAFYIHKAIGPGMLESVYAHCLAYRLTKRNLCIRTEAPVPLVFEEVKLECGYRADLVVENKIVIEVKSAEAIGDIHLAQTLTYLRFLNLKLGIVLNFN